MIIDSHTHVEGKPHTEKDLISSMDEAGIDYALLIADSAPLAASEMTTDRVIQICQENPRLKAIGNIEMNDSFKLTHLTLMTWQTNSQNSTL
jgi:Tat protein secretion system quality control protein TatD with DNase activity